MGLTPADRLALGAVEASLQQARDGLDPRPALEVLAGPLAELGVRSVPSGTRRLVSRDLRAWLRRLESAGRGRALSTCTASPSGAFSRGPRLPGEPRSCSRRARSSTTSTTRSECPNDRAEAQTTRAALETRNARATLSKPMLRIYLDQNKWIEIARVLTAGTASEVVTMIYAAVERGSASFPLSGGHVFETWKAASAARRHALAPAMATISMNHTIAAPSKLLPGELDHAFKRRFGRPLSPFPSCRSVGASPTALVSRCRSCPRRPARCCARTTRTCPSRSSPH